MFLNYLIISGKIGQKRGSVDALPVDVVLQNVSQFHLTILV